MVAVADILFIPSRPYFLLATKIPDAEAIDPKYAIHWPKSPFIDIPELVNAPIEPFRLHPFIIILPLICIYITSCILSLFPFCGNREFIKLNELILS